MARAGRGRQDGGSNPRSCLVSRKRLDRSQLVRFVLDPEGRLVADLKESLPGRGVWVEARRSVIEQAAAKGLFAKALREGLKERGEGGGLATATGETPAAMVDRLLEERALGALALARKAGQLVTGHTKCDAAIRSGEAVLLLHAADSAADGRRKLASAVAFVAHVNEELAQAASDEADGMDAEEGGSGMPERARQLLVPEVWSLWPEEVLSAALGAGNVNHAVATKGGAARNLVAAIRRLAAYRGENSREMAEGQPHV